MKRQGPSNKTRPIYRDIPKVSWLFFVPETRTPFDSSFFLDTFDIFHFLSSVYVYDLKCPLWKSTKCYGVSELLSCHLHSVASKHVRVRVSYSLILDLSLHLRGCCLWKLLWFEPSLASYRAVHVLVASVLASTSSTTFMAALSSNLSSRSPPSTISARS